jgi:hypothetical protein
MSLLVLLVKGKFILCEYVGLRAAEVSKKRVVSSDLSQ